MFKFFIIIKLGLRSFFANLKGNKSYTSQHELTTAMQYYLIFNLNHLLNDNKIKFSW